MKGVILISLVISTAVMFNQSDYNLEFERSELVSYNEHYITNFKILTFKYNRTQPAVNVSFTFVTDVSSDVQGIVQGYTFLSNEYRMFPIHYSFNFCTAMATNDYGFGRFLQYGNFSGCPVKKGSYYIYNWIPDSSKFPPRIPNGKYMFEIQTYHFSVEIAVTRTYGTVSRPFGRRH